MVPKFALLSIASLAFVALAIPPSRLGARAEDIYSHFSNRSTSSQNISPDTGNNSLTIPFSPNFAGAVCNVAYSFIVSTFTVRVPTLGMPAAGNPPNVVFIGLSIGDLSCPLGTGILMAGLEASISPTNPVPMYRAVFGFRPGRIHRYPVASIRPGDELKFTIRPEDVNIGPDIAVVENLTQFWGIGKRVDRPANSALCATHMKWTVINPLFDGSYVPLPDFGIMSFYDAVASGDDANRCNPSDPGVRLSDIQRADDPPLTATQIIQNNLVVEYIWNGY